jgi:hypothetical protein
MADDAAPPSAAGAAAASAKPAKTPRPVLAPRIKRLMQVDEGVGKINMHTPLCLGAR